MFLSLGFMYAHAVPILINQCLMNVVFSITKELNGQMFPKQYFYFSVEFGKICFS